MKLIIDIPTDIYNKLMKHREFYINTAIFSAITNGTPYEERPQGEWVEVGDNQPYSKDKLYGCSECGFGSYLLSDTKNVNFCPICGADMRGKEE